MSDHPRVVSGPFFALLKRARSADFILVVANLFQRGFGFLASLAIARLNGLDAVGLYTSLQITSSTPTTPLSMPLGNSANLVASEQRPLVGLRALFAAHTPILLTFGLIVAASSTALLGLAHGTQAWTLLPASLAFLAVVLLSWGQLFSQLASGIYHGANQAMDVARITATVTGAVMALCVPMAMLAGMHGVLALSVIAALAPGVLLLIRAVMKAPPENTSPPDMVRLKQQATEGVKHAMPSVLSTVIRNGVTWFCAIYITQQHHGATGMGLITIGLQWMAMMQLPVGSWGGRIVAEFANPTPTSDQRGLLRHWLSKCMGTTALIALVIAFAAPWIAELYRANIATLSILLMINGIVSVIMAGTYVQERVAFCRGKQRQWLFLSLGADSVQVLLTVLFAAHAIWIIAAGSLASALLVLIGAHWLLKTPAPDTKSP